MDFLEDKERISILGNLISDKYIVFEVVLSEFKKVKPEFESPFNEYEDYKQTLRNDDMAVVNFSNYTNVFLYSKINVQMIIKKRTNVLL